MSIIASLEGFSLSEILQIISTGRLSGITTVARSDQAIRLVFKEGRILFARATQGARLGESLIAEGLITEAELEQALAVQRESSTHELLASVLVRTANVAREAIEAATQRHIRSVLADLATWKRAEVTFRPTEIDAVSVLEKGLSVELEFLARRKDNAHPPLDAETADEMLRFVP